MRKPKKHDEYSVTHIWVTNEPVQTMIPTFDPGFPASWTSKNGLDQEAKSLDDMINGNYNGKE
jgi:hypothetical protein